MDMVNLISKERIVGCASYGALMLFFCRGERPPHAHPAVRLLFTSSDINTYTNQLHYQVLNFQRKYCKWH